MCIEKHRLENTVDEMVWVIITAGALVSMEAHCLKAANRSCLGRKP